VSRATLTSIGVTFLMLSGACTVHETAGHPSALRPVTLPDLSRMSESVRAQLRAADVSLRRTLDSPAAAPADRAAAYGTMGMLLMAAEYRQEAEGCFLNAQALAPGDRRWPYYLGHLYKERGDTPRSAASFERALALKPDDPATLVWRGESYLDQGRPDAAEPLFARAQSLGPRGAAPLFGLGRAALAKHEYARAAGLFEQALPLDRAAAPVIHYQLAMAYRGIGDLAKADAHMRQRGPGEIHPPDPLMLELESLLESAVAYEVRGAKALDERDWASAAASFRKGIELAPNEPSLHHKLGTALYLSGDADGASQQFEEALRLSPTFAKAHYSLGVLLGSRGRPDQAIAHLSAAVRADPTYVEARLRLADVLRATGRPAESLQHYERVTTLDARVTDAPLGHAMALVALRRYAEARDRLREAMTRYPDRPAFAHALVRLLAAAPDDRVRDGADAMRLMQDLLAREPRSVDIDEMMAMTSAELGQFGDAITWQRQAIAAAEQAGPPDRRQQMEATLSLYEHRRPCRTPWRDDEAPAAPAHR
jgi:tetratricopeptide (TPR) repeat protein